MSSGHRCERFKAALRAEARAALRGAAVAFLCAAVSLGLLLLCVLLFLWKNRAELRVAYQALAAPPDVWSAVAPLVYSPFDALAFQAARLAVIWFGSIAVVFLIGDLIQVGLNTCLACSYSAHRAQQAEALVGRKLLRGWLKTSVVVAVVTVAGSAVVIKVFGIASMPNRISWWMVAYIVPLSILLPVARTHFRAKEIRGNRSLEQTFLLTLKGQYPRLRLYSTAFTCLLMFTLFVEWNIPLLAKQLHQFPDDYLARAAKIEGKRDLATRTFAHWLRADAALASKTDEELYAWASDVLAYATGTSKEIADAIRSDARKYLDRDGLSIIQHTLGAFLAVVFSILFVAYALEPWMLPAYVRHGVSGLRHQWRELSTAVCVLIPAIPVANAYDARPAADR